MPRDLSDDALDVLRRSTGAHDRVFLPEGQLHRNLYVEVNKALEGLGGKWNKKARAHVFACPPEGGAEAALSRVVETGSFVDWKQDLGFFETPPELAAKLVAAARIEEGDRILEPSAGRGALVAAMPSGCEIVTVEIDMRHHLASHTAVCAKAPGSRYARVEGDFLKVRPMPACPMTSEEVAAIRGNALTANFNAIVMNPPFANGVDIDHVTHAISFLAPGGRLAAIMSAGVKFREDRKSNAFRALLAEHGGHIEALPEGSFQGSGTNVRTVMVTLTRAE